MQVVYERLVNRDHALVQLLDPPFDHTALDPGYIKGYVPGVRENGGQYTHAAIWSAMAFAALGDSQRAWELTTFINPTNHAKSPEAIATYKVEPYVIAADIYAVAPHIGRGGWTWYTGSAGWMYRLIIESLLGLRLEVDKLHINPCLPAHWSSLKIHYRFHATTYHLTITQIWNSENSENNKEHSTKVSQVTVDGVECNDLVIPLVDDQQEHLAIVQVSPKPSP
jgi:cellobiose phosphorylase